MLLRNDVKPQHDGNQQRKDCNRRAPSAKGPFPGEGQVVLRVQHKNAAGVPLLQDNQHIIENERRGIGHVGVHGDGGEQHAQHGPERARQAEQAELAQKLRKLGLHRRAGEGLYRNDQQNHNDIAKENADCERQKAGNGAGQLLAPNIFCYGGSWQHLLEVSAFDVLNKSAGKGNGRQYGRGKQNRLPCQRPDKDALMRPEGRGGRPHLIYFENF